MAYHLDRELDPDFWFDLDAPERFAALAVEAAALHADDAYVTVTELNAPAVQLLQRLRVGPAIRSLDNRLAAHALAAAAIRRRQSTADVAMTTRPLDVYELDQLLYDLLDAPALGIDRSGLHDWLVDRRRQHDEARPIDSRQGRLQRRIVKSLVPLEQAFPRAQAAIYG